MIRLGAVAALAIVALALAAGAAQAQQAPRIVAVTVAPAVATVGDRLTLTIEVEHGDGYEITGPGFGAGFGGLELIEVPPARTSEAAGGARETTLSYTLTSFETGTITVPAMAVTWRAPDGTSGELNAPAQTVRIVSVLAPGESELRPLKPQLAIEEGSPPALVPTLFVAIFAALTAFGYWLVARAVAERPPAPVAVTAVPLLPQAAARAALDELAREIDAREDPRTYYARMAAVVRGYLSHRFEFPAYALTRRELQREMSRAGMERWPARLTANLLEQCDAVQFAGFRPAAERTASDLTAAYEIIALTAPEEAPAAGGR